MRGLSINEIILRGIGDQKAKLKTNKPNALPVSMAIFT